MGFILTIYSKSYEELLGALSVLNSLSRGDKIDDKGYVGESIFKLEKVDELWLRKEDMPEKQK